MFTAAAGELWPHADACGSIYAVVIKPTDIQRGLRNRQPRAE